jgi:hypothetical protein
VDANNSLCVGDKWVNIYVYAPFGARVEDVMERIFILRVFYEPRFF